MQIQTLECDQKPADVNAGWPKVRARARNQVAVLGGFLSRRRKGGPKKSVGTFQKGLRTVLINPGQSHKDRQFHIAITFSHQNGCFVRSETCGLANDVYRTRLKLLI